MSELNNENKEIVTVQQLLDNGITQEFIDKLGITQEFLNKFGIKKQFFDQGINQEYPNQESLLGVSKTILDKFKKGIKKEEAEEMLRERYKGSLNICAAHNMEYDYSVLELPKTLTEKQRITDLVKETMDSLKGKSCYEHEILEVMKDVMYKEKEPVSKTDFAFALVSKLKEDSIVKHEGELSSIQKGVVAALTKIESKRGIKNN